MNMVKMKISGARSGVYPGLDRKWIGRGALKEKEDSDKQKSIKSEECFGRLRSLVIIYMFIIFLISLSVSLKSLM